MRCPALHLDQRHRLGGARGIDIGANDFTAATGELHRERAADAAARAGDDGLGVGGDRVTHELVPQSVDTEHHDASESAEAGRISVPPDCTGKGGSRSRRGKSEYTGGRPDGTAGAVT